ncbi:MAG: RNA methyltransferase [Pseudomonadota bacterium]|nr:RNA methyltransferase [Pseudomonadota bacterium]
MSRVTPIHEPDDPRIAAYVGVRERDLVGRGRRFIAEGEVVLRALLGGSRFPVESVFLLDTRLTRLAALVAELPETVPVYVAPRAVMDRVVGFPIHRGVLAVGLRGEERSPRDLLAGLGARALVVGLIGIANHDNVGGIFRNAAAFGADAVLLDATSCDPLYRKAIRVSAGASLSVPFARDGSADDLLRELEAAGCDTVALSPRGRESLRDVAFGPRIALLFGAEGPGLPPDILSRTRSVRVPIAPGFDWLNVATASGIALYEACLTRTGRPHGAAP